MSKAGDLRRDELINKFKGEALSPSTREMAYLPAITTTPLIFRHFKGNYYIAGGVAKDCDNADRTLVIYKACADGQVWMRESTSFFSEVDFDKYPQADSLYRLSTIPELLKSGWTWGQLADDIISKNYKDKELVKVLINEVMEEYYKNEQGI